MIFFDVLSSPGPHSVELLLIQAELGFAVGFEMKSGDLRFFGKLSSQLKQVVNA